MIPNLTGSLTGTKLESLYGDVGQDDLFIYIQLYFNVTLDDLIVTCNDGADVPQPNRY